MSKWSEQIKLYDYFYDDEVDSTIIYFHAPKEYLEDPTEEDIGAEIRVEYAFHGVPEDGLECDIMIGHIRPGSDDNFYMGQYTDDWNFYDITQEQYKELMDIYINGKTQ